jgi:octaprenyl-diphosphate synthase
MVLPVDIAVRSLAASSVPAPDERLQARLCDVQAALGDDLHWIEATLARVVADGPQPASDAARHLVARGGKRIRPVAVLLGAACFGEVDERVREIAAVAELVHSATLLHDDVVDEGNLRRGAPAARKLWGNAVSVLSGDLLLVHALERTRRFAPDVMGSLIETLRKLVDGEIVQLRGRTEIDVSEATYEMILDHKTASLFAWASRTGAALGGASDADQARMAEFGSSLGVAFQLVDDVIDYDGTATGKTLLADLREGKVTLPLVLAVQRVPALAELLRRVRDGDEGALQLLCEKVVLSGACDEVRRRAQRRTSDAIAALRALPDSGPRSLLEAVARELARRSG